MNNATLARLNASDVSGEIYDVVVIGGGITGAGIALDAASRGLSTIIVEKGDFASGTSSKSTKLVHGGLRYLQNLQFGVTLESVRERQLLARLAPHMVWSLPFVIPLYRKERFKNLKLSVGLWVYDLMAGKRGTGFHKRISRAEVQTRCPGVRSKGLIGGLMYSDCRTDDARHTLEVIKTASAFGAIALNYTRVKGIHKELGRVRGVRVIGADGADALICGRVVINATGVWTQQTSELSGASSSTEVVPAKGVHLTLSKDRLPIDCAMILPSPHDKRFCFAVPWYDCIVVGTTDTAYDGDIEKLRVEPDELQYCLDSVNAMFPDAHVTTDDVTGSFAGLRPLVQIKGASGSTADLSRGHHLDESSEGLISIAGGKLTTYRPMAEETVDLAVRSLLVQDPTRKIAPSSTHEIMLGGWLSGGGCVPMAPLHLAAVRSLISVFEVAARALGLSSETASYLPTAYGANTEAVLTLVAEDSSLGEPVSGSHPYILAQVVYAVRSEAARTLDDVLSRRIRLSITDRTGALECADSVSRLLAAELGWTEAERLDDLACFQNTHSKEN
jgi:glycerol-3-phosphate dehydrogenase